jgi:hypothetical protein
MNDLQSAFSECLAWWALTFFIGIAFREFSRDSIGQWLGRASVATSCFVLIAFSQYATRQCQIQYQLTAAKPGKEISHEKTFEETATASQSSREIRTPAGNVVAYTIKRTAARDSDTSMSRRDDGSRWRSSGHRQNFSEVGPIDFGSDSEGRSMRRLPFEIPSLSELR